MTAGRKSAGAGARADKACLQSNALRLSPTACQNGKTVLTVFRLGGVSYMWGACVHDWQLESSSLQGING